MPVVQLVTGLQLPVAKNAIYTTFRAAYAREDVDYKMPQPFVDIGTVEHIAAGSVITIAVPTGTVAVFNARGRIFAIDDGCVRCGASLAEGYLDDVTVSCPSCDWRYDIVTGAVEGVPSLCTHTYEVKIVGSRIMLATRRD